MYILTCLYVHFVCCRTAISFVYVAITLNLSELPGNVYVNVMMTGMVDFCMCFLAYFLIKHLGRKPAVVAGLFVVGSSSFLVIIADLIPGRVIISTTTATKNVH